MSPTTSGRTFAKLAKRQLALLESAAARVRRGGALVYSTCSLAPEENEDVIAAFCQRHGDFALDLSCRYLPEAGRCDGGFAARLVRQP